MLSFIMLAYSQMDILIAYNNDKVVFGRILEIIYVRLACVPRTYASKPWVEPVRQSVRCCDNRLESSFIVI
jgi:hypothetical protein